MAISSHLFTPYCDSLTCSLGVDFSLIQFSGGDAYLCVLLFFGLFGLGVGGYFIESHISLS